MFAIITYLYLKVVALTSRIVMPHSDSPGATEAYKVLIEERPAIFTFWNNKLPFMLYFLGSKKFWIMLTPKRKTEIFARMAPWFGLNVSLGTLDGGGRHAIVSLLEQLKNQHRVALAADGSRGPKNECKAAPLILSQETGYPVIPISWSSRFTLTLKTIEGSYTLPLPFSRIYIQLAAPLYVTKHHKFEDLNEVKESLKKTLLQIESTRVTSSDTAAS